MCASIDVIYFVVHVGHDPFVVLRHQMPYIVLVYIESLRYLCL